MISFYTLVIVYLSVTVLYVLLGFVGIVAGLATGEDDLAISGMKTFVSGILSAVIFSVLVFNFNCSKEPFECSIKPSLLVVQLITTIQK